MSSAWQCVQEVAGVGTAIALAVLTAKYVGLTRHLALNSDAYVAPLAQAHVTAVMEASRSLEDALKVLFEIERLSPSPLPTDGETAEDERFMSGAAAHVGPGPREAVDGLPQRLEPTIASIERLGGLLPVTDGTLPVHQCLDFAKSELQNVRNLLREVFAGSPPGSTWKDLLICKETGRMETPVARLVDGRSVRRAVVDSLGAQGALRKHTAVLVASRARLLDVRPLEG